jgi:hypothetical protein
VPGERHPPSWLPWGLCWISLALLLAGTGLSIAFPQESDDGALLAVINVLGIALIPLVGALIAARMPTNPYGWLWCVGGLTFGVVAFSGGLGRAGAVPSWLAGTVAAAAFATGICTLVFVLLLFPTGRLPGRSWRWVARVAVLVTAVNLVVLPFAPIAASAASGEQSTEGGPWAVGGHAGDLLDQLFGRGIQAMFLLIVVAAGSVLVRFRRAGQIERQQLKWFLLGAALAAATTGLDVLGFVDGSPVWAYVDALTSPLLPAAIGIAVLRYRLYDIDRIVSRTVSYGLLTAALIGVYLLVVALLRPLLEPVTGSSTLAVAGSTLAVAAAFNPARRRLQATVDRRFDRARYDARRAVDAFAHRLRNQVDLDEVTGGLRETVVATVAPTRVAVWLRAPSRSGI